MIRLILRLYKKTCYNQRFLNCITYKINVSLKKKKVPPLLTALFNTNHGSYCLHSLCWERI